jgi:hypothetical protein
MRLNTVLVKPLNKSRSDLSESLCPQALAVMVGLCFAGTALETQAGIQSVQGAVFMFVTENTFMPMYSTLALFPLELPLFMREYRSGLYSTHLYYLSKMAAMVSKISATNGWIPKG